MTLSEVKLSQRFHQGGFKIFGFKLSAFRDKEQLFGYTFSMILINDLVNYGNNAQSFSKKTSVSVSDEDPLIVIIPATQYEIALTDKWTIPCKTRNNGLQ